MNRSFAPSRVGIAGFCFLVTMLFVSISAQGRSMGSSARHDRQFFRDIVANHFVVPPGASVFAIVEELSSNLGSTDSELRDDLSYAIIAAWLEHESLLSEAQLVALLEEWQTNLRSGIGEVGNDSVFRRSFSALCLASLAERDLRQAFLGEQRYRLLLTAAEFYLKNERDLRGYDPQKGWIHSTAHTADLLKSLAQNKFFSRRDQRDVLESIQQSVDSTAEVYTHGEQDRLAQTILVILQRSDADVALFEGWLGNLARSDASIWASTPANAGQMSRYQNHTYFLQALAARMSMESLSPAAQKGRDSVIELLRRR